MNTREAAIRLHQEHGAQTDDAMQPMMVQLLEANKPLGVLDVYMGLEADGKFADGTKWAEPADYDARRFLIIPYGLLPGAQETAVAS